MILGSGLEPLDQHPVPQAPIADDEGIATELVEDRPDDARPGEDHLSPGRLEADDRSPAVGVLRPVLLEPPQRTTPISLRR